MQFQFDTNDFDMLRPVIAQVVGEVLQQLEGDRAKLDGQIAYTEPEAATLLDVKTHVLRDARLRGEIEGSKIGKRIIYLRDDLVQFVINQKLSTR